MVSGLLGKNDCNSYNSLGLLANKRRAKIWTPGPDMGSAHQPSTTKDRRRAHSEKRVVRKIASLKLRRVQNEEDSKVRQRIEAEAADGPLSERELLKNKRKPAAPSSSSNIKKVRFCLPDNVHNICPGLCTPSRRPANDDDHGDNGRWAGGRARRLAGGLAGGWTHGRAGRRAGVARGIGTHVFLGSYRGPIGVL